jgi:hypothetical protein
MRTPLRQHFRKPARHPPGGRDDPSKKKKAPLSLPGQQQLSHMSLRVAPCALQKLRLCARICVQCRPDTHTHTAARAQLVPSCRLGLPGAAHPSRVPTKVRPLNANRRMTGRDHDNFRQQHYRDCLMPADRSPIGHNPCLLSEL